MTATQLDEYVGVIGDVYLACKTAKRRMKVYYAWNESILAGDGKPLESSDDYLRRIRPSTFRSRDGTLASLETDSIQLNQRLFINNLFNA
jgi:hypothetical protein